ncbi:MAG TPA: GNAT family N-acetyltransferase [Chloroflexota bacterium]|nr:GNAT family N-acetyltransferase [Chloroflexota bacterium]
MIAAAEPSALPALARLMADSALLSRYGTTYEDSLAALSEAAAGGDVILVAGAGGVDGFAWLSFAPRILNGAAYLRLLLVTSPGNGLGARLLAAAETVSRDGGAKHLYLLVTTDNLAARRFYERHGYRHVGNLPGLVRPELDEALYHKRA